MSAGYIHWNTPLQHYARGLGMDLESVLRERLEAARRKGERLRVLDVGIGKGAQWRGLLKEFAGTLELAGTSLSRTTVRDVAPLVRLTRAARLHKKFPRRSFDIVVTHNGMHNEELAGLENIHWVLKPGGEAIVSSTAFRWPDAKFIPPRFFRTIGNRQGGDFQSGYKSAERMNSAFTLHVTKPLRKTRRKTNR